MIRVLVFVILQLISVILTHAQPASEKERIDALNQRAESFRGSRPDSMIALSTQALNASIDAGYVKGEADALRWLALGNMLTGQPGVEDLLQRSYDLLISTDNQKGLASTLNIRATFYFQRGAFDLAGKEWHRAADIYRSLGDSTLVINMKNNLGNLHRAIGQFDVALQYHQEALAFRENGTDTLSLAGSLNNVANLLGELGRHSEAITYHERAMALNVAIKNPRSIGNSLMNLGSTHVRLGNAALAIEYYEQAKAIRQSMKDVRGLSTVHSGLADAYLTMNEPDKAYSNAKVAFDLAMSVNGPLEASIASRFAYLALKDAGRPSEAVTYLEIHKTLSDSLFTIDRQKAIANLESVAELNRRTDEIRILEAEKAYERNVMVAILISLMVAVLLIAGIHQARKRERKISAELRQLGDMKDQMLSILSHDLRSPLSSLHSMIELMEMDALSSKEWHSFKTMLIRQFDVTDETLRDVLLWAKGQFDGEKDRTEPVNLRDTVDSNVELIHLIAQRKDVDIQMDVDANATVMADRAHLMAIIRNLLTNAVKFTPAGKKIRIWSRSTETHHLLCIEDEGVGIKPEKLDSLFESAGRFTQGTAGESGSGLGLVFVRDLLRRNKGTIEARSERGVGTTFTVSLPKTSYIQL
jgi:signal transduction histidine kinase/Tfp pilus assembly protein PilF